MMEEPISTTPIEIMPPGVGPSLETPVDAGQQAAVIRDLRHNVVVNVLDGSFFGFGIGFASFSTVLPLFVSTMTDSPVLIGMVAAIHSMGWQLPQIFTAQSVARQKRFLPMVLVRTIHERIPFLGLALVAWLLPWTGLQTGLLLTFLLLTWQGLGGGVTATAWQSMIAKIVPPDRRGFFYGAQSSAANLLAAFSAGLSGLILERLDSPLDFTLIFLFTSIAMAVSWFFLAMTRETERPLRPKAETDTDFWPGLVRILRRDVHFRAFLVVRLLSPLALVGAAFYTVYAVKEMGMSELHAGLMGMVFMGTQFVLNPLMGWLGDRWSSRHVMAIGLIAGGLSGLLAWLAPSPGWFYLVWILAAFANVAIWTIGLAMILEFGSEDERPAYIGLANTLIAPATIAVPFLGGWLAQAFGYPAAFVTSLVGAVLAVGVLEFGPRTADGGPRTADDRPRTVDEGGSS